MRHSGSDGRRAETESAAFNPWRSSWSIKSHLLYSSCGRPPGVTVFNPLPRAWRFCFGVNPGPRFGKLLPLSARRVKHFSICNYVKQSKAANNHCWRGRQCFSEQSYNCCRHELIHSNTFYRESRTLHQCRFTGFWANLWWEKQKRY